MTAFCGRQIYKNFNCKTPYQMNNFEQDAPLRDELQQIVENLNFILENTKNISPIERDIILQHLRDAYLAVLKLRTESIIEPAPVAEPEPVKNPEPVVEPVAAEPEPVVEPEPVIEPEPVVEPEPEPMLKPEPVFDTAFGPESEPIVEPELVVEPVPVAEPEPVIVPEPVIEPEPIAEPEPVVEPEPEPADDILDFLSKPVEVPREEPRPVQPQPVQPQPSLFPEEPAAPAKPEPRRSLNDVLMEQKADNSIASSFQNRKVQDLAKSININDKFLFIKELFRGKGEEFGMAIQKLNRCNSMDEAFNEIDIMKKFYFWDTSSPAYLALCDLVRRKFL